MKVKVIKASLNNYWYADKVGQEFEVELDGLDGKFGYKLISSEQHGSYLDKDDVEIINEEKGMKKSDLRTGMRIKYRNGDIGIILVDVQCVAMKNGFNTFSGMQDDLTHRSLYHSNSTEKDMRWDIMEVFEGYVHNSNVLNLDKLGKLLWKREVKTPEQKQLDIVMEQIKSLQKEAEKLQQVVTESDR